MEAKNGIIVSNEKNAEIVNHEEIIPKEYNLEKVIQIAEKQLSTLEKVFEVAIKRLLPTDWCDQQGKPYLMASGCEKLMPLFGISVLDIKSSKETDKDEKGNYYIYYYKGKFSWVGHTLEAMGACSSRDKFFAWDSRNKDYKPLHDIDETNVAKAAYSNMIVRGVTALLGIRNLTWDRLIQLGFNKEKAIRVSYQSHKERKITEAQRERLFAITNQHQVTNDQLKNHLKEVHSIESTKDINMGEQYDKIIQWIESQKKS